MQQPAKSSQSKCKMYFDSFQMIAALHESELAVNSLSHLYVHLSRLSWASYNPQPLTLTLTTIANPLTLSVILT